MRYLSLREKNFSFISENIGYRRKRKIIYVRSANGNHGGKKENITLLLRKNMKIETLLTKDDQKIDVGKFTVLVGPNNVGKSQTLRDIHSKMTVGINVKTTIIKDIKFVKPQNFEEILQGLKVVPDSQNINQHFIRGINSNLRSGDQIGVNLESFKSQFESQPDLNFTLGNISRFRVSYLDASSRLLVALTAESYNPHTGPPGNLLQGLFGGSSEVEEELGETFKNTFKMDIRLDYSGMRQLTLRVAKEFEKIPEDPSVSTN